MTSTVAFILLSVIFFLIIFYVVFWPRLRVKLIKQREFPSDWAMTIESILPFYRNMPDILQQRLRDLIQVFLTDKNFVGCAGQEITDRLKLTVASQACLIALNQSDNPYPQLRTILVYPSTFVVTRQTADENGVVSTHNQAVLGESWEQGKVVLAWDNVAHGVTDFTDGRNVVIHEFAHQLDHGSGATNGAPLLHTSGAYKKWAQVLGNEFQNLQRQAATGAEPLLDRYGATNPAEFFAVASETFFECPVALRQHHQELYEVLAEYYRLDPENWLSSHN